jgi:hypothetical protein
MSERVECHSGFEYAECPLALTWRGVRHEVSLIEAEWRIPGGRKFRVRTQSGSRFELLYVEMNDEWRVHPLEAAPARDVPSAP